MYLAEAIPTVDHRHRHLLRPDRQAGAGQVPDAAGDATGWSRKIAGEHKAKEAVRIYSLFESMINPKVLLLALNYIGIVTASLGMLIFIPQIIKSIGQSDNMTVGWLTMIPYICGGISLVVWGRISDRMNERRWNLLIACVLSTGGLVMAGLTMGTWWSLVGMSLAAMGFYGSKGPFFAMPPMFLSGTALAAGFAWINSIGNLGGFFGPWWVGVMKDADRQLRRRPLWAGAAQPGVRSGVRPLPAHPRCRHARGAQAGNGARALASMAKPRLYRRLLAAVLLSLALAPVNGARAEYPERPIRTGRALPARRRHRRGGAPDGRAAVGRVRPTGDGRQQDRRGRRDRRRHRRQGGRPTATRSCSPRPTTRSTRRSARPCRTTPKRICGRCRTSARCRCCW